MLRMKEILSVPLICFAAALCLNSCNKDNGPEGPLDTLSFEYQARAFLDSNGLEYQEITVTYQGQELTYYTYEIEPIIGIGHSERSLYEIHYEYYLLDSTTIFLWSDTLVQEPIKLVPGLNCIFPPGLDFGLQTMAEGEVRGFVFPSELASSDLNLGQVWGSVIPLNAPVHMVVSVEQITPYNDYRDAEILAINQYVVEAELNDTSKWTGNDGFVSEPYPGLKYKVLDSAAGPAPMPGQLVTIDFDRFHMDSSALSYSISTTTQSMNGFQFVLGSGEIIFGLDFAVSQMHLGEEAMVIIPSYPNPSNIAYGEGVSVIPHNTQYVDALIAEKVIPDYARQTKPYTPQVFVITLRDIQ